MKTKTLSVPNEWSDVTLRKYLELQSGLSGYEGDDEAQTATLLYYLCGLDGKDINSLSTQSYNTLKSTLIGFMNNNSEDLQRIITIGGVEYGFEPNLSQMSYGAYCDITKFNQLSIDTNWAKIMNILYRPVTKKFMGTYEIRPYDGRGDSELFLDLGMDIHFGAYFFFVHLLTDLASSTLNYSMKELEDIPPSIKRILERSGNLMQQSWN